jgi:short-subunit dehydrogenase
MNEEGRTLRTFQLSQSGIIVSRRYGDGKVVVITGAASGIGKALAFAFAGQGARLALSDIDIERLDCVGKRFADDGADVLTHQLDVAQADQLAAFAAKVEGRWRHVDTVVNNAGVSLVAPALSVAIEDAQWVMNTNFWGVVYGCRAFAPLMRKRAAATIVNMASMFAFISIPTQSYYCASKAAVRGYSDALREELREDGINVLCVMPGFVKTDLLERARLGDVSMAATDAQSLRDNFAAAATITPEHVAKAVIKAIIAKRARLVIGRQAKWADLVARVMPGKASMLAADELRENLEASRVA